jgi:DNA-binding MarR family transcriptional regulator
MHHLYLRFLKIANAIQPINHSSDIDSTALLLLNAVAMQHLDKQPMTVTQAMALHHIASPATIHRKLNELLEAGLVEQVFEGKNRRTKFLVPTSTAYAYFDKMSDAMLHATKI